MLFLICNSLLCLLNAGKCNKGKDCPYIHDPEKIAVCTRLLISYNPHRGVQYLIALQCSSGKGPSMKRDSLSIIMSQEISEPVQFAPVWLSIASTVHYIPSL